MDRSDGRWRVLFENQPVDRIGSDTIFVMALGAGVMLVENTVRDLTLRLTGHQMAAIDAAVQASGADRDGTPLLRVLRQGVRGRPPGQGIAAGGSRAVDEVLAVTLTDQVWRIVLRLVGEDLSRQRSQLSMLAPNAVPLGREIEMVEFKRALHRLAEAYAVLEAQL